MSEQELLSEITSTIIFCGNKPLYSSPKDMAGQIVAKLKAMDYEQVWEECPTCEGYGYLPDDDTGEPNPPVGGSLCPTCKGTGKITNYVKWDRDMVALTVKCNRMDSCVDDRCCNICEKGLARAEELKGILEV